MDQVPILKIGQVLFVSIQIDLQDESVMLLQEDLAAELAATAARDFARRLNLRGCSPVSRFPLNPDVQDESDGKEHGEFHIKGRIGNVGGGGRGEEQEPARYGDSEANPIPDKQVFGELGGRFAVLADASA